MVTSRKFGVYTLFACDNYSCLRWCWAYLVAASAQTAAARKEPSAYDKIWGKFTEWYRDDTNPVVQRVLLSGRFHYDFATIDSDQGDHSEWNVRRLRVGPRITLFKQVHVSHRGRARSSTARPVLRPVYRFLRAMDEESSMGADRRQTERAVYARWRQLVEGTAHDRPEQPGEQHVVSAGIHPRGERFGQTCTVGLSRRSVFVRGHEPGVRGVHRGIVHSRRARLRFRAEARASKRRS